MARVKVRWETTEVHEAEIEVDGFEDGETSFDDLLAEHENDKSFQACTDRQVLEYDVVRAGDEPLSAEAAKIKAPQHEPDWGDE